MNVLEQEGKAMIEFALVLPFLVLITLFGADLYRSYRIHQGLNFLSREMANTVFRSCRGQDAGSDTSNCIDLQISPIVNFATRAGSQFETLSADVRVYDYGTVDSPVFKGRSAHGTPQSQLSDERITELRSYNPLKGEIVIVELFFEQAAFSPFFTGQYYEATLF